MGAKKHHDVVVTREAIEGDTISTVAAKYWAPFTKGNHEKFDAKLVDVIYQNEMTNTGFNPRKIMMLEFSQYLEGYLWPNYDPEHASKAYHLSIVVMVNEKFRERTEAWTTFSESPAHFPTFFHKVLELSLDTSKSTTPAEQCALLTFLVNSFGSVETKIVHEQTKKLTSIEIWEGLLDSQRADLFKKQKKLRKVWENVQKKIKNEDEKMRFDRTFIWKLIENFKKTLTTIDSIEEKEEGEVGENSQIVDKIRYCERFIELMIDLESILQSRRFFNSVLHSTHLLTDCILSNLISSEAGSLFFQLVQLLKFYARFEIDDLSGRQLTHKEVSEQHYQNVTKLQKAAFQLFTETMKDFYLMNVSGVDTRRALQKQFRGMSHAEVYRFAEYLHLVPTMVEDQQDLLLGAYSQEYLVETITLCCERRPNQLTQLNEKPLFPTEKVIWDENVVPYEHYSGEGVLALDKLNLQFLTLHDYLLRNFNLFQLESTYEIRQDLEDVLFRMRPFAHETQKKTIFAGWARMALPIDNFEITEVAKPLVGEKSPAVVRGVVTVNVGRRQDIRAEWENLRKHDVCFLVSCRSKKGAGGKFDVRKPFLEQIEVVSVRGCDVEGMLDNEGLLLEEYASYEKKAKIPGDVRKFRLLLDANQYRLDMEKVADGTNADDIYYSFNLLVRRDSKTNNFKAVLQTIRELLNTECVVPDWLTDVILGYGEPDSAHYSKLSSAVSELDFNDTFLSFDHVKSSFPGYKVIGTEEDETRMIPPFKLQFKDLERRQDVEMKESELKTIVVTPLTRKKITPYDYHRNKNQVLFTPSQIEAIKSGMQPGLTMVVGPPGTGKTDVAVQIISNIYHNWPNQRTLIVTHSNQALNQLFEKIIALDVDERHLLRMGHGEEALETEKDFSRYGRVNYVLKERIRLLASVERLAKTLNVVGDVAYTCENAGYFFRFSVCRAWEEFIAQMTAKGVKSIVSEIFPFTKFFSDIPQLFSGNTSEDMKVAHSCWRHIEQIFEKLDEFRAFELLRNGRDRTEYLLKKSTIS
uniref:Intron-binding protein aquarius n=1 Tax=Caenorhabditis japonica TaxID=281687 RepID=A0A8R1DM74_CAEJA